MASKFSIIAYMGLKADKFKQGLNSAVGGTKGPMGKISGMLGKAGPMLAATVAAGAAVAAAAIGKFAVDSVKEFAKFEKGMNEVFTLMPEMTGKMKEEMSDDVLKLAQEMGKLPEEIVPSLYQAISAGVPKENVFKFMETATKASIGGVTTLETAVDGLTSVVNTYGKENIDAAKAADIMFTTVKLGKTNFEQLSATLYNVLPIAKSMGVNFEQVGAAMADLTAKGVPTAQATTQLRAAIQSLGAPTARQRKTMEMLGINVDELKNTIAKKPDGLIVAMKMVEKAANGDKEKLRQMLGSVEAIQAVLGLTADEAKGFSENLKEMENSTGAATKAFETMDQGTARSFEKIKASIKAAMIKVGAALAPVLSAIVPSIQMMATAFAELPWKELGEEIKSMAKQMQPMFKKLADAGKRLMTALFPLMKIIIKLIAGKAKSDGGMFIFLLEMLIKILTIIEPFLNAILGVMNAMDKAEKSGGALGKAVGFLGSPFKLLLGPLLPLIFAFKLISKQWKKVADEFKKGGGVVNTLKNAFKWLKVKILDGISAVMNGFGNLGGTLKNLFKMGKDLVSKGLGAIWGMFEELMPNTAGLIKTLFGTWKKGGEMLWSWAEGRLEAFKNAAKKVIGYAIKLFKLLFPNLSAVIGKVVDVVKGAVEDIKNVWKAMTTKITGWWSGLKEKVTGKSKELTDELTADAKRLEKEQIDAAQRAADAKEAIENESLANSKKNAAEATAGTKKAIEDQLKDYQAVLIKMGHKASDVMEMNAYELAKTFTEAGEKGKRAMTEYQKHNEFQIGLMKKSLEALGTSQEAMVGKSNEEIRKMWIETGEAGKKHYKQQYQLETQGQKLKSNGVKNQAQLEKENRERQARYSKMNIVEIKEAEKKRIAAEKAAQKAAEKSRTAIVKATVPVVNAAKLSAAAAAKIGPSIEKATPPTERYAKAIVAAAHSEDMLVARLAVQVRQAFIRMRYAANYNMITTGTMKVMGVHLKQLRFAILYNSRMAQFADAYSKALKEAEPTIEKLNEMMLEINKNQGKISLEVITGSGMNLGSLLKSMDKHLGSIDKSLKGKFVNQ